jgi:hypothetical protein
MITLSVAPSVPPYLPTFALLGRGVCSRLGGSGAILDLLTLLVFHITFAYLAAL